MHLKKIVAIVRSSVLELVEKRLQETRIKGLTVSPIQGYGEYANYFEADRMVSNVKIEIFTEQSAVDDIVTAIMESAHTGIEGDGLVAVLPVENLYHIRTKTEI